MKNEQNKIWLVGDRLKNFSNVVGAMVVSDLEKFITSNERNDNKKIEVMIGQGVSDSKLSNLYKHIKKHNLEEKVLIKKSEESCKRTDNKLTHKRLSKNTMISNPQMMNENTYESLLMLDDRCAEMSDHVTGMHIQGMVLLEAARQMTMAVTEKYFLTKEQKNKMSFVTRSMEVDFKQFIFPLGVKIQYQIVKMRGIAPNQQFDVTIKFIQNGIVGTELRYGFSVFSPDFIKKKERELAQFHLEKLAA